LQSNEQTRRALLVVLALSMDIPPGEKVFPFFANGFFLQKMY
jgi:hypothetical protein